MALIPPVDEATVDPQTRQVFEEIREHFGTVPTLYRIAARNPEYLRALWQFRKAVGEQKRLDRKTKEFIILTVAVMNNCRIGIDVHAAILKRLGVDRETLLEALSLIHIATGMTTLNNALGTSLEPNPDVERMLQEARAS